MILWPYLEYMTTILVIVEATTVTGLGCQTTPKTRASRPWPAHIPMTESKPGGFFLGGSLLQERYYLGSISGLPIFRDSCTDYYRGPTKTLAW